MDSPARFCLLSGAGCPFLIMQIADLYRSDIIENIRNRLNDGWRVVSMTSYPEESDKCGRYGYYKTVTIVVYEKSDNA